MTITKITDREIALQKRVAELEKENAAFEKCLETENSARQNVVEMRSILAIENETLRQQLAEAQAQCKKLEQELDGFDKSENSFMRKSIELEALIKASQKQEAVAWRHLYKGNEVVYYPYINRGSFYTEITPLYAAPVVAPDVLKELLWIRQWVRKDPKTGGVVISGAEGVEWSKWIDRVDVLGGAA